MDRADHDRDVLVAIRRRRAGEADEDDGFEPGHRVVPFIASVPLSLGRVAGVDRRAEVRWLSGRGGHAGLEHLGEHVEAGLHHRRQAGGRVRAGRVRLRPRMGRRHRCLRVGRMGATEEAVHDGADHAGEAAHAAGVAGRALAGRGAAELAEDAPEAAVRELAQHAAHALAVHRGGDAAEHHRDDDRQHGPQGRLRQPGVAGRLGDHLLDDGVVAEDGAGDRGALALGLRVARDARVGVGLPMVVVGEGAGDVAQAAGLRRLGHEGGGDRRDERLDCAVGLFAGQAELLREGLEALATPARRRPSDRD